MENNKLLTRVRLLESFAARNPKLYRFRVALLASLGYAYLLFIVVLLLAIVAATLFYGSINYVTIKVLWIPLVLIGLVLRSLWINIPEPDGKELQPEQAPSLFALTDEVSKALRGPKVHHVLVSDEFNASIVQIPQFGMFGWLRNYLVVGLPLLRALSPGEFRAVLAHEFGHLSGKHGWFSGWIYRVRQSWIQILTTVHQERSYASFLFEPFLKWYAPFLNAYSFVLARTQEREADTYAVELAGRELAALALIRLRTKQRALEEDFWPAFLRGAKEQSLAPRDTFTQMLTGVEQSIGHAKAQKWFLEALRVPTGYDDTHPALGDRLAAIGFQKDSAELTTLIDAVVKADELEESAASQYLRELPEDFMPSMNRLWRERIAQLWNDRHTVIKQATKRVAELDEQAKTRALTSEEQWERVVAISEADTPTAALPALRAFVNEHPEHMTANFALGGLLLEQGNPEGVEYLEKTTQSNAHLAGEACELISGFYLERGDEQLAGEYRKRAEECHKRALAFQQQALSFSANDKFVPHDLEESRVKEIETQLSKVRGLSSAYLIRKVVEGTVPSFYVLAVTAEFTWKDGRSGKHIDQLFEELSAKVDVPAPSVFLSLDGPHAYLLDRISRIPGAPIFTTPEAGQKLLH